MKRIYICHAGGRIEADATHEIGIVGCAYEWNGEWIRTPEEVEERDKNPVMKLKPVFGPDIDVYGDVGCFTSVDELQT